MSRATLYTLSCFLFLLLVLKTDSLVIAQSGSLYRPTASTPTLYGPGSPAGTMGANGTGTNEAFNGLPRNPQQGFPDAASNGIHGVYVTPSGISLNGSTEPENPLQGASWTFIPQAIGRTLKVHDIVSIRVDELAQTTAQGTAQSRKNAIYDATISEWVRLVGLDTLKPTPQSDGDPRIAGIQNEVYRASSNLVTREQMTFNIAAEITDIKPNGNIVLTASKNIKLNDNVWEVALSGICRAQDIGPNNVIASKDILDLTVTKNERGHVRDGYSRGWFTRWLARFKPF